MKNRMIDQLRNVMPSGMQIPKEIKALYQYIEDNHLYIDKNGCRYGVLFPDDELMASRTEHGREGGTRIIFYPGGTENLKYWFASGTAAKAMCLCTDRWGGLRGGVLAYG